METVTQRSFSTFIDDTRSLIDQVSSCGPVPESTRVSLSKTVDAATNAASVEWAVYFLLSAIRTVGSAMAHLEVGGASETQRYAKLSDEAYSYRRRVVENDDLSDLQAGLEEWQQAHGLVPSGRRDGHPPF